MSITLRAKCDGCFNTATAGRLVQRFRSFSGKSYGLGKHHQEIEWTLPDGWVAFDGIGCTYCKACADQLWPDSGEQE